MKIYRYYKYLIRYLVYQVQYFICYKSFSQSLVGIGKNVRIRLEKCSHTILGQRLFLDDFSALEVYKDAQVKIDDGVQFNRFCIVSAREKIFIGKNSIFGPGCKLYDHNHKFDCVSPVSKNDFSTSPIVIGRGCWFGSNVVICKGVNIGDFCVAGANKVIRDNIPTGTIVK